MKTMILSGLAAVGLTFVAAPAMALPAVVTPCALTEITPSALACSGFYGGNLLSGTAAHLQNQKDALALIGLDWDTSNWGSVLKDNDGNSTIDFGKVLAGPTWIGIHFGAGAGGPLAKMAGGGGTAFYKLDAGSGLDTIGINWSAVSTVVLYETGVVPEPGTWAMLIAGFGLVGAAARRRKGQAAAVSA